MTADHKFPTLEFERPKSPIDAWMRLPDRTHPEYGKLDGNPYEHVAHFKERLFELVDIWLSGKMGKLLLEERMIPLETDDLKLIFQVNSFYRKTGSEIFRAEWVHIPDEGENPWIDVLPIGDDNYRWWQITTLDPELELGNYRLFCIEMNDQFIDIEKKTEVRFDEHSEFEMVLATAEELDELKGLFLGHSL